MAVFPTITASTMLLGSAPTSAQASAASALSAPTSNVLHAPGLGRPLACVNQAGDNVLSESDLGIHDAARRQRLSGRQVNQVTCDLGRSDIHGQAQPRRIRPGDGDNLTATQRQARLPAGVAQPGRCLAHDGQVRDASLDALGRVQRGQNTPVVGAQIVKRGRVDLHQVSMDRRLHLNRHLQALNLGTLQRGQRFGRHMHLAVAERPGPAGQPVALAQLALVQAVALAIRKVRE